jgi:adenylate kinase
LKQFMENQRLYLTGVLNYRLPLNEIMARFTGRRTCQGCKAVYHALPGVPRGWQASAIAAAGNFLERDDDRPESVKVRLEAYEKSTAPLIEFYQRLSLLVTIAASGSPEETCERTIAALEDWRSGISHANACDPQIS